VVYLYVALATAAGYRFCHCGRNGGGRPRPLWWRPRGSVRQARAPPARRLGAHARVHPGRL